MTGVGTTFPSKVLIVDDEQTVIDVLKVVLKKHKLESTGVLSGEEALELLRRERFGCLICDKNLPGMSGLEVIREAKKMHPYCACLVMTGYPTSESMLEAMRLGASDYLEKPFPELGLVVQRVNAAMEHARVGFEREALVRTLREMRTRIKKSEEAVFQRQTELDVLGQVLELKVDEATAGLKDKISQLEEQLAHLRGQPASAAPSANQKVHRVADALKAHATRAGLAAKRPKLSVDDAREALENLERSLSESADELLS